ncbi:ABC transporter permease [Curtobacterium sp. MCBD17_035]|uniref:ABC transporter permease n=1 Tax=unclassified Curtobacterium TaxID=257496 RepID=UPI001C646DCD|nr:MULTISPECIES: ABC transporter permease [unclassified Curtobacterium]WIB68406.1 ABC transporter permease [Curtobacterium sp. MCBD17_035]
MSDDAIGLQTESPTPAPMSSAPRPARRGLRGGPLGGVLRIREFSVLVVDVALIIYFAATNHAFLTGSNIGNIANFLSAAAIIAAGEVFLLICGEIDLSAGMTFALTPILMVTFADAMPLWTALLLALVVATLIGLFNGVVNQYLKLPSFIATLGTLYGLHGVALAIAGSTPLPAPTKGALVAVFGGYQWSELVWAVLIVIVMQVVLTSTRSGVHTIATGANLVGASEAGIAVRRVKIRAFMLTSLFAGLAGILDGTNIAKSFDPNAGGNDLMFMAIAAAVLGGTSLIGGSGTVVGAFLGALLLAVLQDGFNIEGISATTFVIVEGAAILLAMILNIYLARFRQRAKEQ